MRRWGDLSNSEKGKRLSIGVAVVVVVFAILGTIAILQRPTEYVPPKDTRPVFNQDN